MSEFFQMEDSFEVLRSLGEGAAGKTFLVRSNRNPDQIFALKTFQDFSGSLELKASFERECEVLEKLEHPHLARVFQHGQQKDQLFFTSEYVEGSDFITAARKLDWNAIFILIVQAAWALDYLHEQGFIHRDLKPSNLLVGRVHQINQAGELERLQLKIIDFGLAFKRGESSRQEIVGTLPYIAPEILKKEAWSPQADLYSLGVILYEVAVGRLPFEIRGQFSKYLQQLSHQQIDLFPLQEWGTPKGIVEIISGLLKLNPHERISKASRIIEILNREESEKFSLEYPKYPESISQKVQTDKAGALAAEDRNKNAREVVHKVREFAQKGQKEEGLKWVAYYLPQVSEWKNPDFVEGFYRNAIYFKIEAGEFLEAKKLLEEFSSHRVFRGEFLLEFYLLKINLAYREGNVAEAEQEANQIPSSLLEKASPDQFARFYNYLALLAKTKKCWKEASDYFEKASLAAQRAQRPDLELSLLLNGAGLLLDRGEWKKSYELYQKAIPLAEKLKHETHLAYLYHNLGNLYLIFGRWNEAGHVLSQSLQLAQEQNLRPLMAYNFNLLIQTEEGKGNWEKVKHIIDQSLAFSEELGDSQPILQAQLEKAYFEWRQKNDSAYIQSLQGLKEKAQKFHQSFYLIQADWLEARYEISKDLPDKKEVLPRLEKIKKEASENNLLRDLWQVWADEGSLYQKIHEKGKAIEAYHQALKILDRIQEKIPKEFHESFWRDRKKEKIKRTLIELEDSSAEDQITSHEIGFTFNENDSKEEVFMDLTYPSEDKPEKLKAAPKLSFQKWVEINRRLLTQNQIGLILDEILDDAISITDAERGFVIYSDAQELDVKSCRNIDGEVLKGEDEKFSYTIAQEVMRKGEAVTIFDAQKDERFSGAKSVLALKIRSVLCIPLRTGLKTVGLVYLDNRFREGIFQREHLPLVEALTDQASLALEHARLNLENQQKIEELKKSNELIEKLNKRLERDLGETTANLDVMRESLKRQNEEISLRYTYDKIIGESSKIKNVLKKLDRVVDSNMSVFIHGESGTGKELVAQAIHFNGLRKDKPFIAENCTALPETLLESELFGHVQGAFTGADKNKVGLFELANHGTLFLDEVGDMPLSMQAKLLRVLQEGEVRQVGGKDYRKVDVRIITASNKDLKQLVAEGKFRQDLYYRINVMQIDLPPLRERKEDIPLLLDYFMEQETQKIGQLKPKMRKDALKILMNYDWPGNIRELLNEVIRLTSLGGEVEIHSISNHIVEKVEQGEQGLLNKGLDGMLGLVEKKAIIEAMQKARGNKVKAAKFLKIGRRTLYAKLDLYKIDSELGKNAIFMAKPKASKLIS